MATDLSATSNLPQGKLIKDVAREDAERILGEYWVPVSFPVDPFRIAEQMGIKVFLAKMSEGVSGTLIKRSGEPAGIYLNVNESGLRQNFTCAHEIGHYIDRSRKNDLEYSFQDLRNGAPNTPIEFYADHFAANLTMPEKEFLACFDAGYTVKDLMMYFAVSEASVETRIRSLRLV